MQESFVDLKENQRRIAEKDTSFGVLHTFQKRPNPYIRKKFADIGGVYHVNAIYHIGLYSISK